MVSKTMRDGKAKGSGAIPRKPKPPVLTKGEREARSKRLRALSACVLVLDLVDADLEDLYAEFMEARDYGWGSLGPFLEALGHVEQAKARILSFWDGCTRGDTTAQKRRALCKGLRLDLRQGKIARKRTLR